MKTHFHSAALAFSAPIWHHWHALTGKAYGKVERDRQQAKNQDWWRAGQQDALDEEFGEFWSRVRVGG